jgi:hypothetical protein
MKWIKNFDNFKESLFIDTSLNQVDLMESLSIWQDVLLASIKAKPLDIYETFYLDREQTNLDAESLFNNTEFINSLNSIGLKKSVLQNTDDFQTFLNKSCKFFLIYKIDSNELENPEYMIFQSWNQSLGTWEESKLYKIEDDIQKFYDKLTSRTIEINDGDQNYIYSTSNGNDWQLQNLEKETDTYKRVLRKNELQKILDNTKIALNII